MLNCDLCEYYCQDKASNKVKCICELTGFEFLKEPREYDMENYPCYYFDFEKRSNKNEFEGQTDSAKTEEKITA